MITMEYVTEKKIFSIISLHDMLITMKHISGTGQTHLCTHKNQTCKH